MKRRMKKLLALVLTAGMMLGMSTVAFAEEASVSPQGLGTLASKTDELLDRDANRYKVQIDVPGKDGVKSHDEVILMVDGSYSGNEEWEDMKAAIIDIAKTVLNGSGDTLLTLMAFGMGDNEVIVHAKDAAEVGQHLGTLPKSLLYGRSSTNCEAGFTGVAEYIDAHDATLNDAYVIFISDANINTDEKPYDFYDWKNVLCYTFSAEDIAVGCLYDIEIPGLAEGELEQSHAFQKVFGKDVTDYDALLDSLTETNPSTGKTTLTDEAIEKAVEWADIVWADVYEAAGLTPGTKYPISTVERAFVTYDKTNGTYLREVFYYATWTNRNYNVYHGDRWTRTPAAAEALAAKSKVKHLYLVETDSDSKWMNIGVSNSTYLQSSGIAGLIDALKNVKSDLKKTPYNDVVITDYMSKWVDIDLDTLQIVDQSTDTVIWTATEGWTISENRPTAQEVPVVAELVDPADYAAGGADVVGNASGDIYKLTWHVKDGAMVRADNYRLEYEVTVDTGEATFEYDKDYPANGETTATYVDEDDEEVKEPIEVPQVNAPAEEDQYYEEEEPETEETVEETVETETDVEEEEPDQYYDEEEEPEVEETVETETTVAKAPKTADVSCGMAVVSLIAGGGLAGVSLYGRKRK